MSRRRLFLALWPDARVRQGLVAIRNGLEGLHGKPAHPEDLHVTLVFLGDVEAQRQGCVEAVVERIRAPAFDLQIDQVGYWGRPRIFWCGPTQTPEALKMLVRDLTTGLKACGFEPERRPYAAHVTLARKARPLPFQELAQPLVWPVRELVLVASRPGIEPPRYEILKHWPLSKLDV